MPEIPMFMVAPPTTTSFHPPPQPQNNLIPLLNISPDIINGGDLSNRDRTAAVHLWQNNPQPQHLGGVDNNNYPNKKTIDFQSFVPDNNPVLSGGNCGGSATCEDCGNQAKKDCPHKRCRTCCRSRGFDCSTHVKSTWVPASRRRQRHLITSNSSESTSESKRRRLEETSNSNTAEDTGSSRRDTAALPREVTAPAVFKCVKVTAVDGGEDEFAYQAVVNIGGHVFKGFLYDQGTNPKISQLSSAVAAAAYGGGGVSSSAAAATMIPMDLYGGGGGGFLGGSAALHYGNAIN